MRRSYYLKRIIPCALVILVCLCVVIMSIQVAGFTDRQRMRLAEKAHMVGPSDIIGRESGLPLWGDVLIGKSNYGYTLFCCDSDELYYHKKGEDFTVFSPMNIPHDFEEYAETIPVFMFTQKENAIRAKLTVTICNTNSGAVREWSFSDEAIIHENGYFLFQMPLDNFTGDYYIDILTEALNQQMISYALTYGTVTLELYDRDAKLIESYTREFSFPEES